MTKSKNTFGKLVLNIIFIQCFRISFVLLRYTKIELYVTIVPWQTRNIVTVF